MKTIFTNQTTNVTTAAIKQEWFITSNPIPVAKQTVYVWGTFDTANVQLQVSHDGVEWFTLANTTFTAKSVVNIEVAANFMRGVVATAGATTSVNMVVL